MDGALIPILLDVLRPENIALMFMGTLIGLIFGILPGFGPALAIALMIPLSFGMDPLSGLILMGSTLGGGFYGGSITSILLNIPGMAGNIATTFDGHPMAKMGKAGVAIGLSVTSSLLGGIFGYLVLLTVSPLLVKVLLLFGPPEYFMLILLALTLIAGISRGSMVRGLTAMGLGLIVAMIGLSPVFGTPRFSFGSFYLEEGLPMIPILIGLFAISEVFVLIERKHSIAETGKITGSVLEGVKLTFKYPFTLLRSALIGTGIGILPGAGVAMANFVAYAAEYSRSKKKEKFGTGIPEGIIAPETANNAVAGGSLIPTLSLGIPGGEASAVLLGGLMILGLRPGLDLFTEQREIFYAFGIAVILSCIAFFIITIIAANLLAKITTLPYQIVAMVVILLSFIGAFAYRNTLNDVALALIFGIIGYAFRKLQLSRAAFIIALILEEQMEVSFHQTLMIAGPSWFFTRPISLGLFITFLIVLALPYIRVKIKKSKF